MSEEMTRAEMLKTLSEMQAYHGNSRFGMALSMAIAALSAEPCSDTISRAEAQTEIMMFAGNCKSDEEDIYIKVSDAVQLLRDLPSVHAEPRTGHWINEGQYAEGHSERWYRCSECGGHIIEMIPDDYCKFCGAKMESEEQI